MKTEKFIAIAHAKSGKLLPGGVKMWQSYPQNSRNDAKNVLAGYIDGHQDSLSYSIIKPIKH